MSTQYVIVEQQADSVYEGAFEPFGALRDLWYYRGPEAMVSGPYETGKTYGCLQKLNALLWRYPNSKALMVRKSYKALIPSALATFYNKVLPHPPGHPRCSVEVFGGGKPDWIDYPNGSRIMLGGMDVPEKVLSSEYDFIFVPQAEELSLHDWEQLGSRCTGRAGNAPYSQIIGDCNPDVPTHWILNRPRLKVFNSKHTDNPTLFEREPYAMPGEERPLRRDVLGNAIPTLQGQRTIEALQALTGVRYKRGYLGLWVGAEGQVYEDYDANVHLIDSFPIPYSWKRYRVFDFGFTHPFVCQWWAEDDDGRLYRYREIYYTRRTIDQHLKGVDGRPGILDLSGEERYTANIADWDAEDRATLQTFGIRTTAANKEMRPRFDAVQNRLRAQKDGRARIFFFRDALVEEDESLKLGYKPTCTEQEILGYVWRDISRTVEATSKDERPVGRNDHGMDAMGYMVMHLDGYTNWGPAKVRRYI
jgi:PBSX family phage terminase large subunit